MLYNGDAIALARVPLDYCLLANPYLSDVQNALGLLFPVRIHHLDKWPPVTYSTPIACSSPDRVELHVSDPDQHINGDQLSFYVSMV
jgi:hypothetical protein